MRADRPLLTDRKSAAPIQGLEQEDAAAAEVTTPEGLVVTGIPAVLVRVLQLTALLAVAAWVMLPALNETPVVDRLDLRLALPRTPGGWHGNLTHGSNPSRVVVGGRNRFTSTSAWRTYTQGDREITVEIWDWGGDYPYHLPFDTPGWMNGQEVRIGSAPGHVRYNSRSQSGRLRLRYLDRFYVIVEGEGIAQPELEAWYGRVDFGRLRAALGKLRSKAASR